MEGSKTAKDGSAGSTKAKARYDELTAAEVVKQLPRLPTDALERVRAHEEQHKARATVLRAIDALLVERGDALTIDEDVQAPVESTPPNPSEAFAPPDGKASVTRCSRCQATVTAEAKFCPDCGAPLTQPSGQHPAPTREAGWSKAVEPKSAKSAVTARVPGPVPPSSAGSWSSGTPTSWGSAPSRVPKKNRVLPDWRPLTWVILVINILFLIWVIAGIASAAHTNAANCANDTVLSQQDCTNASNAGTAIGVGIVIFFWAAVDAILGVIWLVTRSRGRTCPVCGTGVKRGYTACRSCGHDFRQAVASTRP